MIDTYWGYWQITDEQAAAIVKGDRNARDKFYMDNLKLIRGMAVNFCAKRNSWCKYRYIAELSADDLVQQVYLDIPYLSFDNGRRLSYYMVARSFRYAYYGGFSYLREQGQNFRPPTLLFLLDHLTKNDEDDGKPMLDFLASSPSAAEEYDALRRIDYTPEIKTMLARFLSPKECVFMSYFIEGYDYTTILEKMNIKQGGALRVSAIDKLKVRFQEVLKILAAAGCIVSGYPDIPAGLEQAAARFTKTPEQRALAVAKTNAWRARKRAAATA